MSHSNSSITDRIKNARRFATTPDRRPCATPRRAAETRAGPRLTQTPPATKIHTTRTLNHGTERRTP